MVLNYLPSSLPPGRQQQTEAVRLGGDGNGGLCATNAAALLQAPSSVAEQTASNATAHPPPLLVALLGDALLPSVWTEGTAVNRGLLSTLDTTWLLLRAAALDSENRLGVDAQATADIFNERERLYQLSKIAVQPIQESVIPTRGVASTVDPVVNSGVLSGILRPQPRDQHGCVQLYRADPASRYTASALAHPLGMGGWIHTAAAITDGGLKKNGSEGRLQALQRAGDRGHSYLRPAAATAAAMAVCPSRALSRTLRRHESSGSAPTQLVPYHYRMRLHSKAVGAAKGAPPQKRRAFEAAVLQDLTELLGVDQTRIRITGITDDDDEDEYPPLE